MSTLLAIKYEEGRLDILDQLLLPESCNYVPIKGVDDAWAAIREMKVRGAPAIAIVGSLSLAVELRTKSFDSFNDLSKFVREKFDHLITSRPTAVNLRTAYESCTQFLSNQSSLDAKTAVDKVIEHLESSLAKDISDNVAIGDYGSADLVKRAGKEKVRVLTHCNTGSLATAGYGTALGVVRSLHKTGKLDRVFCTETRPYNQGSRLTAFELVYEKIPGTLICDDMAAAAMKQFGIDAVIVGADRVAANGDTANKIGTYQLAVLAQHHGIPFYVAAPFSSIDFQLPDGQRMPIEERPHAEMTHVNGTRTAAAGIDCWNPAFDVTPARLITGGIITEKGVYEAGKLPRFD